MKRITGILLLAVVVLLMLWTGYVRERKLLVIKQGIPELINRYPKPPTENYGMQLKGLFRFNPSPKLQSSVLFGLLFTAYAALITLLLTHSKKLTLLTTALYLSLLLLCFLLLQLGALGVNYHLSIGLSHYLEDIVLSPFLLMLLVVLFRLNGSIKI